LSAELVSRRCCQDQGVPILPDELSLRDDDLVLRDWAAQDASALEPVCGEWNVCQFTSVPWVYTPSAALAWIDRQHARRLSGSGLALAITVNDLPVGNVNLVRFSDDEREAALGYWLVPAARGQGLAARSARMLCAWGFRELQLERIELAILPENVSSHAVAERLGACREGMRPASHQAGGRLWDMVIYALTAVA
jgi:ribosomal-protein-alanine N-acetyltransferase